MLPSFFADNSSDVEPEAVDSTFATVNGHSWSSLVSNKESPIEFYFASDARYVNNKAWYCFIDILKSSLKEKLKFVLLSSHGIGTIVIRKKVVHLAYVSA